MAKKRITDLCVSQVYSTESDMVVVDFRCAEPLPPVAAGQFVELNVPVAGKLLNRPFSVFSADAYHIELLVKNVGVVSGAITAMKPGDKATAIGPLGNGYSNAARRPLLVGGGVGLAPMLALTQAYTSCGVRPTVIIGSRTHLDPYIAGHFKPFADVTICTDDGSEGFHGLVTASPLFKPSEHDIVQCCGPTPMMKAVAGASEQVGIPCEVSLENRMACGLGACLCCVQDMKDGTRRCVCSEGPVFNSTELQW